MVNEVQPENYVTMAKHGIKKDKVKPVERFKSPMTLQIGQRLPKKRERLSGWEANTVSGKRGKTCLVTLTERKSRFLLCKKVEKKSSEPVSKAIISLLHNQPCFTITPDRGKEFSRHAQITAALNDVPFYCPPHQSWQRGTNENTNGLLKRI